MKSPQNSLSGDRILCVDDCPEVLDFLRSFLVDLGAEVMACESAEKAIVTLRDKHFDILISDLNMPPGLDGYDLVHALREMETENPDRKATPSILISGNALQPSRKRRFADFQVYMSKPFDPERLAYVVERLVEADSAAVKIGSLGGWEAQQATEAALIATDTAAIATSAAVEATASAVDATNAAVNATNAATRARSVASKAEADANAASVKSPLGGPC